MAQLALETNRRQLATSDAIDSKLWQALGTGSVVIGLGVAAKISGGELTLAFLGYIALAFASLMGLYVRGYKTLPDTTDTWKDYWFRTPEELDRSTVDALGRAEIANRDVLNGKAGWLKVALISLAVETGVLILVAIF